MVVSRKLKSSEGQHQWRRDREKDLEVGRRGWSRLRRKCSTAGESSQAEKSKAPNQYCWQESKWLECGRNVSKVFSSFFSSLSSKISRRRHLNHRGGYSKNLPFTPPSFPDVRHKQSWPSYYLYAGNIRGKPRGTKNTKPPHIQGCHLRSSVNKCRTANNDKF